MKQVPCSNKDCSQRRVHHENPYENRSHVMISVADDWDEPYIFCSFTCAIIAGKFHIKRGWIGEQPGKTVHDSWLTKD